MYQPRGNTPSPLLGMLPVEGAFNMEQLSSIWAEQGGEHSGAEDSCREATRALGPGSSLIAKLLEACRPQELRVTTHGVKRKRFWRTQGTGIRVGSNPGSALRDIRPWALRKDHCFEGQNPVEYGGPRVPLHPLASGRHYPELYLSGKSTLGISLLDITPWTIAIRWYYWPRADSQLQQHWRRQKTSAITVLSI